MEQEPAPPSCDVCVGENISPVKDSELHLDCRVWGRVNCIVSSGELPLAGLVPVGELDLRPNGVAEVERSRAIRTHVKAGPVVVVTQAVEERDLHKEGWFTLVRSSIPPSLRGATKAGLCMPIRNAADSLGPSMARQQYRHPSDCSMWAWKSTSQTSPYL